MTSDTELESLPLDALHRELGAKMAPFAGYAMPVQYAGGILSEHKHTRNRAGLFDISHMGQIRIWGPAVAAALETLVPGDLVNLPLFHQRYSVFTTDSGGVLDDCMITNAGDHFFLVVNAARKAVDIAHLIERMPRGCHIAMLSDHALLALQGPDAGRILERLAPGSDRLECMAAGTFVLDSVDCFITRCGYTGEDGFEISVPTSRVEQVARNLLSQSEVAPIGLGARDTLRLEAGLCLYGHELDESTSLVEAGLAWIVAKGYLQSGGTQACFPGARRILEQIRSGTARKRVGLLPEGRAPVRDGAQIMDDSEALVGHVTSGGFSPSLQAPVAMAYLDSRHAAPGTRLNAWLRNTLLPV
ncbi:MAG: glycine cleavage system aminomethyltransferase GcvT, partial [Methylocella sp.]